MRTITDPWSPLRLASGATLRKPLHARTDDHQLIRPAWAGDRGRAAVPGPPRSHRVRCRRDLVRIRPRGRKVLARYWRVGRWPFGKPAGRRAGYRPRRLPLLLQLYDGGRIALPSPVGPEGIRGPSPIPSARPNARTPRELHSSEIDDLIAAFARAAGLGVQAGFDGIEIHGANHYLIHQFFSPRANQRNDDWGGDVAQRARFPLAVAAAVRSAVGPAVTVGFRVTPFESEAGGYTLDDLGTARRSARRGRRRLCAHLDGRLPQELATTRRP